jgi:hypothetical protein
MFYNYGPKSSAIKDSMPASSYLAAHQGLAGKMGRKKEFIGNSLKKFNYF